MHSNRTRLLGALEEAGLASHLPVLLKLRLTPREWLQERSDLDIEERCLDAQLPLEDADEDETPTVELELPVVEMPDADDYLARRTGAALPEPPPGASDVHSAEIEPPEPQPRLRRGVLHVNASPRPRTPTLH